MCMYLCVCVHAYVSVCLCLCLCLCACVYTCLCVHVWRWSRRTASLCHARVRSVRCRWLNARTWARRLIGSVTYGEDNAAALQREAVAYLNVDVRCAQETLLAQTHPRQTWPRKSTHPERPRQHVLGPLGRCVCMYVYVGPSLSVYVCMLADQRGVRVCVCVCVWVCGWVGGESRRPAKGRRWWPLAPRRYTNFCGTASGTLLTPAPGDLSMVLSPFHPRLPTPLTLTPTPTPTNRQTHMCIDTDGPVVTEPTACTHPIRHTHTYTDGRGQTLTHSRTATLQRCGTNNWAS
jgi:hypothetical protein